MSSNELHIIGAKGPRTDNWCVKPGAPVDRAEKSAGKSASVVKDVEHTPTACGSTTARESEGRTNASFAGCNANNANAGRTSNCNNAVSNSNDNYARGFADDDNHNGTNPTSRPTRSKISEDSAATGGQRQCEYSSLPFWGDDATESSATPFTREPDMKSPVWKELKSANKKRKLKGLSRFYADIDIALEAVRRATKSCDTPEKTLYNGQQREAVARRMISDIANGTYRTQPYESRRILRKHKSGKDRDAKVFSLYDRCMQMFAYLIIGDKLNRKIPRHNYSNTPNRGILCRDRRYCMMTRIRTATWKYSDCHALTTDIRKFYDNVGWRVMMGVVEKTVKDRTTLWLLGQWLREAGGLPVGMCLSPVLSDLLMAEHDTEVLRCFPDVRFFAAFGDNRLFIGPHDTLQRVLSWQKSYYAGRYNLDMKDDYQIWRVADGFRFCKTWYSPGYVRPRGEMRRRAIRLAYEPQRFAGYNGLLLKSDGHHLLWLIDNRLRILRDRMANSDKIQPLRFTGDDIKFDEFVGKKVAIVDFERRHNNKDSQYYYVWQYIAMRNGHQTLCRTNCGSHELKQVGDVWTADHVPIPQYVTIGKQGHSIYFEEWHVGNGEACDRTVREMGIDLSLLG